jgi:peptide/nickel transport system ATP-binding protein
MSGSDAAALVQAQYLVKVQSLSVRLSAGSQREVIRSLDLEIRPGEIFGLMGPSGCGKSTLLRVLAGIERRWTGHVRLLNTELEPGQRRRGELRRAVQMVFQDPYASLHPLHTVERTLLEPLRVNGLPASRTRVSEALDEVRLAPELARRYPHELSGGQRQRVAIARALLLRPLLLLLDEPTSALDLSVQAEVLNLLNQIKAAHGMTLLVVSHDRDVIGHLCDRAALMREGRIERLLERSDMHW